MHSEYEDIRIAGGDTAQPLALEKRLRYIRSHMQEGRTRFLDCGCGAGDYVFALIDRLGLDAAGIEYEAEKVRQGNLHPKYGQRISRGDLQSIESPSEQWDYAMLNEVLEHVPDEATALREVYRILKPGGTLFVFSPNRWFPFETHGTFMKKSGRRVPHWVPFIPYIPLGLGKKFLRYWARNYSHRELRGLITAAGFSIIEKGFVWQTFEGISGRQPALLKAVRPVLRAISNTCEALPVIKGFGVSQALVCRKN